MRTKAKINLLAAMQSQPAAPVVNDQMTLNELIAAWHAWRAAQDDTRAEAAQADHCRLRKWQDAFGHRVAWSITTDEVAACAQGMLQHGYAMGSINRDVGTLGMAYKWVIQARRAPAGFVSPTINAGRFKEEKRIVEVAPEVLDRLRAISLTFTNKAFPVFIHLLIDSGARKTELLERTWAAVDMQTRRIRLTAADTKTRTARTLFFSPATAALIDRMAPERSRHPSALLFRGRVPTEPIDFRSSWRALTEQAGCPDLHLHDLRHNRARELLVTGVPIAQAAQIMGHSVKVLEDRYGHLAVTDKQRAAELTWAAA